MGAKKGGRQGSLACSEQSGEALVTEPAVAMPGDLGGETD